MNAVQTYIHNFAFNVYPYVCLAVFLMGSLARYDRDQYTWKSDSSQMLRAGLLRWGSNLFHFGILFLFMGHFVGLLTPHWVYEPFISPAHKQVVAVVAGGMAGAVCPNPSDQPQDGSGDTDHSLDSTDRRADHATVFAGAQRRRYHAGAVRLGATHRNLSPQCRRFGRA